MNTVFTEVAKNLITTLEKIQKNYHPIYIDGWKVCRHGVGESFNIIREYPLISDLKLIHTELKNLVEQVKERNLLDAIKNSIRTLEVLFVIFKDDDTISINREEKDSFYNYTYYAKRTKEKNGGRIYLDDNIYPIARDNYGTDCIRLPELYSGEGALEYAAKKLEEAKQKKLAQTEQFQTCKKIVAEKYGHEITKIVLKKKGHILKILSVLVENKTEISSEKLAVILESISNAYSLENIFVLLENDVNPFKAEKIAEKAFAWAYVKDAFPKIDFTGFFDSAQEALRLYAENFSGEFKIKVKHIEGDGDIAIILRDVLSTN